MPVVSPIQPAFTGGEITPRALGRVDLDVFKTGLAYCSNFRPTPQGSLLMRAGTRDVALFDGAKRVIPFKVANSAADYLLVFKDSKMRIFDRATGARVSSAVKSDLHHFDVMAPWTVVPGCVGTFVFDDALQLAPDPAHAAGAIWAKNVVPGAHYRITVRARAADTGILIVQAYASPPDVQQFRWDDNLTAKWVVLTHDFVPTDVAYKFILSGGVGVALAVDYFMLENLDTPPPDVNEWDAPWTADQLPDMQWDVELAKSRVVLVHPRVAPQVVVFTEPNIWELLPAVFTSQPAEWGTENYPSIVELGFQGRSWFGATPNEPHMVWYSKSGVPFDFTRGVNADNGSSFSVSTKGSLQWMRGQKTLLAGGQLTEHSADGNGTIIAPGNVNVQDESAYGSSSVQAAHIGEEVLFVSRDRRTVRALSYDALRKGGWVATPVSFFSQHLLNGIEELHFVGSPDPVILAKMADGTVAACTYDRASKVTAWWRISLASVVSAAPIESEDGGEFWLLVERADGTHLEALAIHETGVDYLDSWSAEIADGNGEVAGLERFEGATVKVKQPWVDGDQSGVDVSGADVVGGKIAGLDAGAAVFVGLPFTAKATTLPLEGGNPAGTSQGLSVHYSEVIARLSNSARPLISMKDARGERATLGKAFGPSLDKLEDLITKDVRVASLNVTEGGQIDIVQDAPFRTEVCAVFGSAEVSKT